MNRLIKFALLGAALLCTAPAPAALAAGGGGGGNMNSPPSAPRRDPAADYQAGIAAINAQNYREAVRHLRAARRALPNDGAVNYALGLAYSGDNNKQEAREAFERSTRAANAPAGAWLQLGLVEIDLGRADRALAQQDALAAAIAACDEACGDARRSQLQAAHDQLAQALARVAPPAAPPAESATTSWDLPSVEQGRASYAEAVGFINQDRFADAYAAFARAREALGPDPDVLNYLGFTSRKMGRLDDALAYYRSALRLDPSHLGATEYLGELYIQMGDLNRAHSQLARLDDLCAYGCAQREELARWIERAE